MDGAALGEVICDAYYAGCQAVGTHSNATLSLTDLTRTGPLLEAYEAFGAEALAAACEDPGFFSRFARIAAQSENYGGNTREQATPTWWIWATWPGRAPACCKPPEMC